MKKEAMIKKPTGPIKWEDDDEIYPRKYTHCAVCNTYGERKLAWDRVRYLCIHAGKCIARAIRGENEDK